jgi:hypothetical protein
LYDDRLAAKVTAGYFDRPIRLAEFLREDTRQGQTKLVIEWMDRGSSGKVILGEACGPDKDG